MTLLEHHGLDTNEVEGVLGAIAVNIWVALNIWFEFGGQGHGLILWPEIMRRDVQAVFASQFITEVTARGTVRAGSGLWKGSGEEKRLLVELEIGRLNDHDETVCRL